MAVIDNLRDSDVDTSSRNTVFVRLPRNLDLLSLVKGHDILKEKGFKIDKLYWLVSTIYRKFSDLHKKNWVHSQFHGDVSKAFFIPLSSKFLLNMIGHNYTAYTSFLMAVGVIDIFDSYIAAESCKSFRMRHEYRYSESIQHEISDPRLWKKIRFGKIENSQKEFSYVKKMQSYIPHLILDVERARALLREKYEIDLCEVERLPKCRRKKMMKKLTNKYFRYKSIVDMFEDMSYYNFIRNRDHYRIYSIVTKLPKFLRHLVTCDGKALVQVDLVNAQFFTSLKLLCPDTWKGRSRLTFNKKLWKDIACNHASSDDMSNILKLLENTDISKLKYTELLQEGKLYESMIADLVKHKHIKQEWEFAKQRKKAKNLIMNSTFDDTTFTTADKRAKRHSYKNSVWNIFRRHHPLVVEVFNFIKNSVEANSKGEPAYKDMAKMLQRLEAIFMIDVVCKRLVKEYPKLKFYLLHDCVVTTIGNEQLVADIIEEEMINFLGFAGKTEVKEWKTFTPMLYDFSKVASAA